MSNAVIRNEIPSGSYDVKILYQQPLTPTDDPLSELFPRAAGQYEYEADFGDFWVIVVPHPKNAGGFQIAVYQVSKVTQSATPDPHTTTELS